MTHAIYQSPYFSLFESARFVAERIAAQTDGPERGLLSLAKSQLVAALRDGAIVARGQFVRGDAIEAFAGSVTEHVDRILDSRQRTMFPFGLDIFKGIDRAAVDLILSREFRIVAGPAQTELTESAPFREIGTDWWSGVGLEVEVHWEASALARQLSGAVELMRRTSIKEVDLWTVWPAASTVAPSAPTPAARMPPTDEMQEFIKTLPPKEGETKHREKAEAHFGIKIKHEWFRKIRSDLGIKGEGGRPRKPRSGK